MVKKTVIKKAPKDKHKQSLFVWFTRNPTWIAAILFFLAGIAFVLMLISCAPSLDNMTQTLSAIEKVQVAAMHSFETFEQQYEVKLVHDHLMEGKEEAQKALDDYKAKRDKIVALFMKASQLDEDAHMILPLVQDGKANRSSLDGIIAALTKVATDLGIQLKALGIGGN